MRFFNYCNGCFRFKPTIVGKQDMLFVPIKKRVVRVVSDFTGISMIQDIKNTNITDTAYTKSK